MEEYIKFNTDRRKEAGSSFKKNCFKIMVNSIYGKSMENLRKRIYVRLINNAKDYVKCVSKPNFISQKTFSKNFVAIYQIKPVLTLNKPIYVGFSILDLSKLLMYKFHYEYIRNKFDAKLLFTDTGSLVYEIKGEDVYEKSYKDKDLFDFFAIGMQFGINKCGVLIMERGKVIRTDGIRLPDGQDMKDIDEAGYTYLLETYWDIGN